jgi:hypothetical protein
MKKFITILIGCALTAGAMAQQDEDQGKQKKKEQDKSHPAREVKPGPKVQPQPRQGVQTQTTEQAQHGPKGEFTPKARNATKVPAREPINKEPLNTIPKEQVKTEQLKKERNVHNGPANANKVVNPTAATANEHSQVPVNPQGNTPNVQANKLAAQGKKPDIQAIKAQHVNFHAQPKPQQAPSVTFNKTYRINGSDRWQGEKYAAFRSYHPEMHDQGYYHSHYNRVELIGGGYYYWNDGYWYPAWGYSPSESYYAYDGPIYVGSNAEPPDKVIADVQSALQEQGYYQGEVDGLLGPLTRQALAAYQSDAGLTPTEAIDEPTLSSLGMG